MAEAQVANSVPAAGGARIAVSCQEDSCADLNYDNATLDEIQRIATERFLSIPRGGLEVGGLLFGQFGDDGNANILGAEDFPIEYLSGPSFTLSERDELALAERLERGALDADLVIVGWWHTHTRSDVTLSAEDLRIHRKFFPSAGQLAVIVKPFKFDPAEVAIYRPGGMHGDTPCASFTLGKKAPIAALATLEGPPPAPVRSPDPLPLPAKSKSGSSMGWGGGWGVATATLVLALIGLAWAFLPAFQPPPTTPAADAVRLSLSGAGKELIIRWDGNSSQLASAKSAELVIVDGTDAKRIPLSVDSVRSSMLAYVRNNSQVEVRLRAWSPENTLIEAVAHYVGPATEEVPKAADEVQRMQAELDRLNDELSRMRNAEPLPAVVPPQAAPKVTIRRLDPPRQHAAAAISQPAFIPPPTIATTGVASPPVSMTIQSPPPAAPAVRTPQPGAPAAAKLQSGRAIWTGVLPRGGILQFDGRRPNSGTMTGSLPQRRSRVRVFPADLTPEGIVVYTDGSRQSVEPPGAANGWNRTTYRADGKRSREVTVVEAPSPSNSWQRLMIRSEQRPVSMLVVEWEEIQ